MPPLLPGEPEAIFIVGAARSGTTLMRNILERSPRIAIARENHFLGHLRASEGARHYFRRAGDLASDDTIRRIVEMIYSGEYQRQSRWREVSIYWRWLVENVPQSELEARLLAGDRTERGLFAAFLRTYADWQGRPVMGEKTPAHLGWVDTLIEWFPDCRVVHMIRDPRGVYVSDLRRRRAKLRKPYSWLAKVPGMLSLVLLLQSTWVWRGAAKRHFTYEKRYPKHYKLVRFEDVVTSPDETLGGLFAFLGVEAPPDPTNVKVMARGFKWGEEGLDADAADRWREHIGSLGNRWLWLTLGGYMRRFGYKK
ncbi:MAG TPA: sulfotransferase [Candidatus Limnocylindrales bacterium]|nr:sulfotransferase [Candidatus Limnocylindrales bacterium]